MATTTATTSYWCYRCTRFVAVSASDGNNDVICPHCDGGFVEEIQTNSPPDNLENRFMHMLAGGGENGRSSQDSDRIPTLRFRRNRRNAGDRSPFNPVVVLRGGAAAAEVNEEASGGGGYEFYYNDGTGSGLRPVPASMSEVLMGSGFDRLLDQLAQIEVNGLGRVGNPPASKAVVESMPTVEVTDAEANCAVCKEAFELGGEGREMPCKHIYHSECILPWLALRNSCPVCRHELPPAAEEEQESENSEAAEEEIVGLTIWRLPGGGFAVGRFSGGRRGGQGEFPGGVFTEMDGGFPAPRRVSWMSRRSIRRDRNGNGGLRRVFRGLFSFIRRIGSNSNSNNSSSSSIESEFSSMSRSSSQSSSVFGRYATRRRRGLDLQIENGTDRW